MTTNKYLGALMWHRELIENVEIPVDKGDKYTVVVAPTYTRFRQWLDRKYRVVENHPTRLDGVHEDRVDEIIFLEDWQESEAFKQDPAFLQLLIEMNHRELERKREEQEEEDVQFERRAKPLRERIDYLQSWNNQLRVTLVFLIPGCFLIGYLAGAY